MRWCKDRAGGVMRAPSPELKVPAAMLRAACTVLPLQLACHRPFRWQRLPTLWLRRCIVCLFAANRHRYLLCTHKHSIRNSRRPVRYARDSVALARDQQHHASRYAWGGPSRMWSRKSAYVQPKPSSTHHVAPAREKACTFARAVSRAPEVSPLMTTSNGERMLRCWRTYATPASNSAMLSHAGSRR